MGSCRVELSQHIKAEQGHNGDGLGFTINVHKVYSAMGALDSVDDKIHYQLRILDSSR